MMWLYGSNLRMRDLVFRQVSTQCAISNNVLYLNDLSASLNDTDFVSATGTLNLRQAYQYNGKIAANIANLETLQPLLRASGDQNALAGTVKVDWQGSGSAETFKNTGKLNLTLEKGRYGNLESVQARIDASYSPDGLDVPIIFFATSSMDFQAIAQSKGDTLEIDRIQLNQAWVPPRREARRKGGNQVATERQAVRSGGAPSDGHAVPTTNYAYG